ncbi:EF-hand domain-containing protein [Paraburkholderia terrae]
MKRIHLLLLALVVTTPVFAQGQAPQLPSPPSMSSIDPNARLTKEQLQALMPPLAAHFDEIDTTRRGYVTSAQIQQFLAKQVLQPPSQFPPKLPS